MRKREDKKDSKGKKQFWRPFKPRPCRFCQEKVKRVDFKDINRLRLFLTDRGKIVPRRISGNCAKHQRQITEAVKKMRELNTLPYVIG
jgi:small subunit ribosomal protein S18